MDFNKIVIGGRMCADPELKQLPSGTQVANFRIATNRRWKDAATGQVREETCFVDAKAFGKRAPVIAQYFKKGSQILIEGHLRYETWEKEGEKRSKHVIVAESFSFVDPKKAPEPDEGSEPDEETAPSRPSLAPGPVAQRQRERALAGAAVAALETAGGGKLPF